MKHTLVASSLVGLTKLPLNGKHFLHWTAETFLQRHLTLILWPILCHLMVYIPYTLRTILEPLKCASKDAIFFPLSVNPPGNFLHEAGKLPVLSISLTSCKYQDSWWDAGSFPILRWCDYSDLSEFESRLQFSEKMLNYKGLGWMPSKII